MNNEKNNDRRDSFIVYRSFYEAIKESANLEEKCELCVAIWEYGLDRKEPVLTTSSNRRAFALIKPQLDANYKKYIDGKKGGAPKGNQNARKFLEEESEEERQKRYNSYMQDFTEQP